MIIKYLLKHQCTHIHIVSMIWGNKGKLWCYTNLNLKYGSAIYQIFVSDKTLVTFPKLHVKIPRT